MPDFDASKSLHELECHDMGEPEFDSHLVTECHRLHRVPLKDFTVTDLRLMVGQNIGLEYLVPLSLEHLRVDPLSEGMFFPGDLLVAVLRADSRFWVAHPELRKEVAEIEQQAFSLLSALGADQQSVRESLSDAYDIFQQADYFAKHGRA